MRRQIAYQLTSDEFVDLRNALEQAGYFSHGYIGLDIGTIDNGQSKDFERCSRFAVFDLFGNEDHPVNLKINDTSLSKLVDAYFKL